MDRPSRISLSLTLASGLLLLSACGGGGGNGSAGAPPAKTTADVLSYTNPSSGTYLLVKNASKSSSTHLVLDLLGPAGTLSGVGFYLSADPAKVSWVAVDPGDPERTKSSAFSSAIVVSRVSGATLQAGIYQKGTAAAATVEGNTVLASVALDLKPGLPASSAGPITLSAGKASRLNGPSNPVPVTSITIATGILSAS